jgi:hypothetical protein
MKRADTAHDKATETVAACAADTYTRVLTCVLEKKTVGASDWIAVEAGTVVSMVEDTTGAEVPGLVGAWDGRAVLDVISAGVVELIVLLRPIK